MVWKNFLTSAESNIDKISALHPKLNDLKNIVASKTLVYYEVIHGNGDFDSLNKTDTGGNVILRVIFDSLTSYKELDFLLRIENASSTHQTEIAANLSIPANKKLNLAKYQELTNFQKEFNSSKILEDIESQIF
jgi:hypothetical protein